MPTKITVGETYEASKFRSGENSQGSWEMIAVRGGKGQKSVTIFATNIPSGVVEGGKFTVDKIESVTVKAAKDANGNWTRSETVVNAEVTAEKTHRQGDFDLPDFDEGYDLNMDLF
jgi:hypothetical protein